MAWTQSHAKLHTLLRKKVLLPKGSHILMAVSGGQDSLCLARLLSDLSPKWQWSLGLVHCDHRWRPDSAENSTHVLQLARSWDIPAWAAIAESPPDSEAAARQWRYETFSQLASSHGYSYVVTGHTASDRAETVLYNLIRGTGLDGLGTLAWQRPLGLSVADNSADITLVRPLLSFTRQETGAFCHTHQLPVWEDSTNQTLTFRRNHIRKKVMPYLKEHFNPQVEQAIAQSAEIFSAEAGYLQAQTEQLYPQLVVELQPGKMWQVCCQPLLELPLALQRRILRRLLQCALPVSPSFEQVEQLITLLDAPNGSRTSTYPGGWVAQVRKPYIWIGLAAMA